MKPRNPSRQSLGLIVLSFATAGLSILSSQSAQGAAYDWIGATNATWDSGWTGSNVPTSSDDLSILGPLNAAGALNINVAASAFANSLNFTDTAAVTLTNTTSGANQTLTLQNGLTIGTGAVTNGSTTVNQGVSTTLGANQAWTIGTGGLTTNSAVNLSTFNLTKSGAGGFTLNGPLTGSGTITSNALNFGNATPNGSNGSNSGGFTGALNVGGLLGFNSPGSFNGADYYYNFSNAAVTFTVGGSTQWNAANGGANNDPGIAYINFGSLSSASGVGTLVGTTGGTVNTKGARYIVGTLNTDTSFGGVVSPSSLGTALTKVGTGTLTLTGTHTYAGIGTYGTFGPVPATTIRGGTLQLGDGTSGSLAGTGALTFQDSGRFNYQGQTAGSSQSLGTLTFAQGGGTVQSTSGSSGNTSLTFASLAARAAGATGNFVVSGG
ncbi:MAG: autotransporter-associated beta strand repeat-containing protein, partial [Luteolibacter sp.]